MGHVIKGKTRVFFGAGGSHKQYNIGHNAPLEMPQTHFEKG
jgi:hypothetical protein